MKKTLTFLILTTVILNLLVPFVASAYNVSGKVINKNTMSINQSAPAEQIDVTSISIGRLKIGMEINTVISLLGQPIQRKRSNSCVGDTTNLKYKNLEIDLLDDKIIFINTSSRLYATEKGLRVGDSVNKVKKAYSKFKPEEIGKSSVSFFNSSDGGRLSFATKNGKVTRIILLSTSC
jgi:hypothetical protein